MLDTKFETVPEGTEKLRTAVSIRNEMGGALYLNICNDDCLKIAKNLLCMGIDRLAIQNILDGSEENKQCHQCSKWQNNDQIENKYDQRTGLCSEDKQLKKCNQQSCLLFDQNKALEPVKPYILENYKGFIIWYNEAIDRPYYIGIVHFKTIELAHNYADRLTPMDRK
jgi:hypothetical protein